MRFITECGDLSQLLQKLRREGFQGWLVDHEGGAVDRIVDRERASPWPDGRGCRGRLRIS